MGIRNFYTKKFRNKENKKFYKIQEKSTKTPHGRDKSISLIFLVEQNHLAN